MSKAAGIVRGPFDDHVASLLAARFTPIVNAVGILRRDDGVFAAVLTDGTGKIHYSESDAKEWKEAQEKAILDAAQNLD